MRFSRINAEKYHSLNGVFEILQSKEEFWYYRLQGFIKGKILVSAYTYQDYNSISQFLQRSLIHDMKELETNKNFQVIINKDVLLNDNPGMRDWMVSCG